MKRSRLRHIHCLRGRHTYEHHPPTMLARYNLRGQEASDYSGAFFFGKALLEPRSKRIDDQSSKPSGISRDGNLWYVVVYLGCATSAANAAN